MVLATESKAKGLSIPQNIKWIKTNHYLPIATSIMPVVVALSAVAVEVVVTAMKIFKNDDLTETGWWWQRRMGG